MSRAAKAKVERLPEKLRQIRTKLKLSQNEMLRELGLEDQYNRSAVSGWETSHREPPLPVVLRYAKLTGISTDLLIDDELNLPARIAIQVLKNDLKK